MNWTETARTNYVKVTDKQALFDLARKLDADVVEWDECVALLFEDGIPTVLYNEDGEDSEVSVIDELIPLLADSEVCILTSVGHEGLRYMSGVAYAFNNRGETRFVDTSDIYDLARQLTTTPATITRAEA